MHKQRLGILIAAAAGMLGSFLPWVSVPFLGSISGIRGSDGWINLVIFAIPLIMALIGNKESILDGTKLYVAVLFGAIGAGMGIWKIVDVGSIIGEAGGLGKAISVGFGLYLIVLAGIAVVVLGFVLKKE